MCLGQQVVWIERAEFIEYRFRSLVALHLDQRGRRFPKKFAAIETGGRIVGKCQDVPRPIVLAGNRDQPFQVGENLAEVFGSSRLDVAPVNRLQPSELFVNGTANRLIVNVHGAFQDSAKPICFGFDFLLPGVVTGLFR